MNSINKIYVLISICYLLPQVVMSQDQKVDTLIAIYESENYNKNDLGILNSIIIYEINPKKLLKYSELLIEKSVKSDSANYYQLAGYLQKGNALRDLGNYSQALEAFFESIRYATLEENKKKIGLVSISIADVYSELENSENAVTYYNKGIDILRKTTDSFSLATGLLN